MPISLHIRADLGLIVSVHEGDVSDAEFFVRYQELFDSPDFDIRYDRLIDLRGTTSKSRSPSAMRAFADYLHRRYEGAEVRSRTAVVAPRDVSFGMARMAESLADSVIGEFEVFRTVPEALAWLGVQAEEKNVLSERA